ncbi:hypothetical protein [Sorangium sp. So ce693]|uniref:hypothetical protein n=1 Tax=Sorangium sp. So ce693 TaxID=3133318 RepID=UPI003F60FDA4
MALAGVDDAQILAVDRPVGEHATVDRGSRSAFAAALKLPSCATSTNVAIASKSNIVQPGRTGYSPVAAWSSAAGERTVALDMATAGSEGMENPMILI